MAADHLYANILNKLSIFSIWFTSHIIYDMYNFDSQVSHFKTRKILKIMITILIFRIYEFKFEYQFIRLRNNNK